MMQCYRYVAIFVALMLCSCAFAKQANIREEFDQSMKGYNKLLRWHEVENAGMIYMDPELRDAFMKSAEEIKKRGVTITDYRILTSECIPEKKTAEVVAEFDYYALPSNRIKTLTYRQSWTYLETEEKKGWQLKTSLPAFD
jgi:hypothetical protein